MSNIKLVAYEPIHALFCISFILWSLFHLVSWYMLVSSFLKAWPGNCNISENIFYFQPIKKYCTVVSANVCFTVMLWNFSRVKFKCLFQLWDLPHTYAHMHDGLGVGVNTIFFFVRYYFVTWNYTSQLRYLSSSPTLNLNTFRSWVNCFQS